MYFFFFFPVDLFIYLPLFLSIYLCLSTINLSIYPFFFCHLSFFVFLSTYLSIYLSLQYIFWTIPFVIHDAYIFFLHPAFIHNNHHTSFSHTIMHFLPPLFLLGIFTITFVYINISLTTFILSHFFQSPLYFYATEHSIRKNKQ